MDTEVLKFWSQFGAMGLCTGVVLWIYARQASSHAQVYAELTERWEKMTDDLRLVVRENTQAFVKALEMIQGMQRQIDRWDGQTERRSQRRAAGS